MAAWVLVASLIVGALAGCGTKPDPLALPGKGAGQAPLTQTLTLSLGDEPPSLDSATAIDQVSFLVLNQVNEGLVRAGQGGEIKKGSGQAVDWTLSPDGVTYTFTLRDGLTWSDGKPVTSKDFAYGWLRAIDPKTASPYNYMLFYIKGAEEWATLEPKGPSFAARYDELKKKVAIETPTDKTLKVTLVEPTPYFLGLTAMPTYFPQRQDLVESLGERYAAEAANLRYNGPFVIKSWAHQSELTLAPNPKYWDAPAVRLQTVNFRMVKDASTALSMFEAGQLDSVGVPGQYITQYRDKPGFQSEQTTTLWYLTLSLQKPYLQNKHIRRALSLALDRQLFAEQVLHNGSAPALGFVPDTIHMAGESYRKQAGPFLSPTADAKAAQRELALGLQELHLEKLPALEFLSDVSDVAKKYGQGIQGMIQQHLPGVTVNIQPLDFKLKLQTLRSGNFDLVLAGWGADYDDPNTFLSLMISGSPQNEATYTNKEYDKLMATAALSQDQKVRLHAFKNAERILMDDLPILPLYIATANYIRRPYIKGIVDASVGPSIDLKRAYIEGE